jgi:hypothetical protein
MIGRDVSLSVVILVGHHVIFAHLARHILFFGGPKYSNAACFYWKAQIPQTFYAKFNCIDLGKKAFWPIQAE